MRRRSSSVFLLALACGAAGAQTASTSSPPAAVSGTVANSVSGEPILRAHVTLRSQTDSQTVYGVLSDAEGKFALTPVPAGTYSIDVEKVGYHSPTNQYGGPAGQIKLDPGAKKDGVKLQLVPGGSITGRVVDAEGQPVEGASVRVSANSMGATTDQKGEFRIGSLRPGRYRISASDSAMAIPIPPEIRSDGTEEAHYALTYFPSTASMKEAGRVTVGAGGEVSGIEIRLIRAPVIRISGNVIGLPANVRNAMFQLENLNRQSVTNGSMVQPDGSFEIWRLDPGKYRISASWQGGAASLQSAPVEIEVAGKNIDKLELTVLAPSNLSGTVQYDDDKARPPDAAQSPAQSGQTAKPAAGPPPRLFLQDIYGNQFARRFQVPVQPDGTFSVPQMAPGAYVVTTNWGPTYVKSMQLGAAHMDGRILDLRFGAGGNALSVVVSSAVGEISGTVRTGTDPAAQGTTVLLLNDPSQGSRPAVTVVNADGTYRFGGVAPGKYRLAVLDKSDQSSNVFERTADDFEELTDVLILPGDKITQDLKTAR